MKLEAERKKKRQEIKCLKALDFVHNVKKKKFPDHSVVEKRLGQVSR